MKYLSFEIKNYRGITKPLRIDLKDNPLIPLIGINECGKTTILQAIYCFDQANDLGYDGKHLKDTLNLYQTSDEQDPIITAVIEIKYSDLEKIVNEFNIKGKTKEETKQEISASSEKTKEETSTSSEKKEKFVPQSIQTSRSEFDKIIRIERNLKTLDYQFAHQEYKYLDPIAEEIVRHMPYILYNDDFMDRPPNFVKIPSKMPNSLSDEWLSICERLFNKTNSNYSLFKLVKEADTRRRNSIISDVEEELNKRLSKAWKTFLLSSHGSINVQLNIMDTEDEDYPHQLEIKIVEKIGKKERFFDVVDRSKGFLWFFNFVMKLEFNPKVVGSRKDTIYLLDEPGSYLHSSAQEKLCTKIKNVSDHDGAVVYCTHSHHLLDPELIPINKIYIVEKERNKNIIALPVTSYKPQRENISAFQPLMDALQIPAFDFFNNDYPIIAVEGIYDKYVIKLFVELEFEFNVLPGTNANSIIRNIQFLNGFSKNYIAIWDNDEEGDNTYKKACKHFGEVESKRFDKLPSLSSKSTIMQQMFVGQDLLKIRKLLDLPHDSDYKKTITTLYYADKSIIEKAKKITSRKTKDNFDLLKKIILKRFDKSRSIRAREIE